MEIKPIFDINSKIDQTEYYWFKNAFSEEELEWVENLKELYPYEEATIVGATNVNSQIRESKIRWINLDSNSLWVYEKLKTFAVEANESIWGFDLNSIIDSIQYTEYNEGGGHYDWHMDIGPSPINHRKVSLVTLLSDPDDYEGGDLQLWVGGEFKTLPRLKGCTIVFPSFSLHRVTPVTKGMRKSLVLWVGGGTYK